MSSVEHGPWLLGDLRGGYAAPTPATDGQRLYVAFGSARISALDMQGKELWRHDIDNYKDIDVCFASSPILYRDTVILLCRQKQRPRPAHRVRRRLGRDPLG